MHSLTVSAVRLGYQLYVARDHKRRIKAQTKVTNDALIRTFIFFEKFACARKGDLIDVALNLIGSHTDAVIVDGDRAVVFVEGNLNGGIG